MKKFLPKSLNNPSGFTLVELLVVITIIAILSVIGLAVFTGVQSNARNARRRADINSISKAWEVHYDGTKSPVYPQLAVTWFSNGAIPRDPKDGTTAYSYSGGAASESAGGANYKVCADLESVAGVAVTTPYCSSSQQQ